MSPRFVSNRSLSAVEKAADACCMKPVLETSGEREIVQEMVQECGHMPSSIEAVYSEWLYLRRKWKRAQQVHDGLVGWTIGSVKRCAVSLNSCELHGLLVGKEAH